MIDYIYYLTAVKTTLSLANANRYEKLTCLYDGVIEMLIEMVNT